MNEELFDKLEELQNDPTNRLTSTHVDLIRRRVEQSTITAEPPQLVVVPEAEIPVVEAAPPTLSGLYVLGVAVAVLIDLVTRLLT